MKKENNNLLMSKNKNMRTYIIEGIVTVLSSISHNSGERNGINIQLRREGFVQPNGKSKEIPIISGNSIRGKFRDLAAIDILTKKSGEKIKVDDDSFNLLFSGGSLESAGGDKSVKIDKAKQLRKEIPMLSVLGGSVGNAILPGKLSVGKMIPICKETLHILPEHIFEKLNGFEPQTLFEYIQTEFYTRKNDSSDERYKEYLENAEEKKDSLQMMYNIETIKAGTKMYWKLELKDCSDEELGAFLNTLNNWSNEASQVGGNGRIGFGALKLELTHTEEVNSDNGFTRPDFVSYIDIYNNKKDIIAENIQNGILKKIYE